MKSQSKRAPRKILLAAIAAASCCTGSSIAATEEAIAAEEIDARVESIKSAGHFPGVALAILRDGEPVYVQTYGFADLSHDVPVSQQTVFELASLTKHMTALAITTLAEQRRLSLNDRLVKYVNDAPDAWSSITINQLLSNMAGMPHRFETMVNGSLLVENSRDDMLQMAFRTKLISEPGSDWKYSDMGFFMLGVVIEHVTGMSFADYMQQTFFEPLGMKQTHLLDQSKIVPKLAQGYRWKDGELQRNRRVWQFGLTSHFGVMSSLDDMIRWEAEISNPTIVNASALEATSQIQRTFSTGNSCDSWGYARGWQAYVQNGKRTVSHGGYAGTSYVRALDDGVSVIVLTNREDNPEEISPMAIAWAAANAVEPGISAEGFRCWE